MVNTTVIALKKLCAAIKNDGTKWEAIPGETVPDVIDQITLAKGGDDPGGELATDGESICIAEADAGGLAVAAGTATVNSNV